MRSIEVEILNPAGLHARPAALFVRTAARYRSRIQLENLTSGRGPVDARTMVGVLAAGVRSGQRVRIIAEGEDEAQAVEGLEALVLSGLGEKLEASASASASVGRPAPAPAAAQASVPAAAPAAASASTRAAGAPSAVDLPATSPPVHGLSGTPGSPGIAIGPIWRYVAAEGGAGSATIASGVDPGDAIRAAAERAAVELETLADRVRDLGREEDAGIFEAQALMAADPSLLEAAIERAAAGLDPAAAVREAASAAAGTLARLDDELLAARAADVRDVGARIVRILTGDELRLPDEPSIAVAEDLPPSVTAEIPPGFLLGIALEGGSRTAHAVILARGLGIPAIVGTRGLLEATQAARTLAMDGATGEIVPDPATGIAAAFRDRLVQLEQRRAAAASLRGRPGATADGERVVLVANIGSPDDAPRALEAGAEGVGLFRTEFLYMRRQTPPTEDEQAAAYRRVLEAFGPQRPVVIRLADVGGDKAIPYLGLPAEANPFLGVRAIRLAYPAAGLRELLLTQLRAIWRAGAAAGVVPHIMAPMVATIGDVRLLLDLRDEARRAVEAAGEACAPRMVTGIMVEVPAAAVLAAELARLVDFFSIGTNDLTQYTMAADRGNASLAQLQDALHPAVLRTIRNVVAGADAAGIPVAVCGELAGDPAGALVLVGLGVDELSADAGSLDGIRSALARATRSDVDALAERALAAPDAETVRGLAAALLERL